MKFSSFLWFFQMIETNSALLNYNSFHLDHMISILITLNYRGESLFSQLSFFLSSPFGFNLRLLNNILMAWVYACAFFLWVGSSCFCFYCFLSYIYVHIIILFFGSLPVATKSSSVNVLQNAGCSFSII